MEYIGKKNSDESFIMALDEGTAFQPMAIHLLVDRMKKHPAPAAVCGRIHPIGGG